MYVCPKIYIRLALNKVTDAPQSQTNKHVFNVRLKCSVDRSTERKEVGRLLQILDPATAKLRSPNVPYCWYVGRRTSQWQTIEVCTGWSQRWADSRQQGKVAVDRAATYGSAAPAWILHTAEPVANGADEELAIYESWTGLHQQCQRLL